MGYYSTNSENQFSLDRAVILEQVAVITRPDKLLAKFVIIFLHISLKILQ